VLDRSWYGRVLVERVEGFATEEQWRRAYREIVEFERTLADEGMIMIKFWLHLSVRRTAQAVQGAGAGSAEDVEADRGRLAQSRQAAPVQGGRGADAGPDRSQSSALVLVEAEDKRWARVKVVESVVAAIEAGMAARNLPVPPPPPA